MSRLADRLAALSQEQRSLLALRARKRGLQSPSLPEETMATASLRAPEPAPTPETLAWQGVERKIGLSLFFFSADGLDSVREGYRLLLDSARFADRHGFEAIWTPERHFQDFGGLYPNPSVLSAALGQVTERLQIRAGSLVLPLHNPIRVAEDWALLDNLTGGRVGISFATGWHSRDFVLSPGSYASRRDIVFDGIELIRSLWRGDSVDVPGVEGEEVPVRLQPPPVQPELPIWLTSSGSPETWVRAGEIGANILTALHGDPAGHLTQNVASYREARRRCGHDPAAGRVTVMLHTFLGSDSDEVRERVRPSMVRYFQSFLRQTRTLDPRQLGLEAGAVTEKDLETLAHFTFERYYRESSLLGTPDSALRMLDRLCAAGADEAACLVDFGLDAATVLQGLERLAEVRERLKGEAPREVEVGGGG